MRCKHTEAFLFFFYHFNDPSFFQDFDHIFGTLLKGAQAKLEPPAGKTALDGLEVKVGFNNQFKDSLNELSGGKKCFFFFFLIAKEMKVVDGSNEL